MLLIHKKCGGFCKLDVGSIITVAAPVKINKKGMVKIDALRITKIKDSLQKDEFRFVCDNGCEHVNNEDVVSVCGYCRKIHPISELLSSDLCGDLICKSCNEEVLQDDSATEVESILNTVSL